MDRMRLLFRLVVIFTVLSFIVSCGGGSSEPDTAVDEILDGGSANDPDDVGGGDSGGNGVGDSSGGTDVDDDDTTEASDPAASGITLLYLAGEPVPSIDGAVFSDLNITTISPAGLVALSAEYRVDNESGSGLWIGPPESPALIYKTGDAIDGLPANVRFAGSALTRISGNGGSASIVQLSGASTGQAVVVSDRSGSFKSIMNTGMLAPGFAGSAVLSQFQRVQISNAGTLISATVSSNPEFGLAAEHGLWWWNGTDFTLLAASQLGLESSTASTPKNIECQITLPFLFDTLVDQAFVNDSGDIVFSARLADETRTLDCRNDVAVISLTDGVFSVLVSIDDQVPGMDTATFGSLNLRGITDSGSAIVFSLLNEENITVVQDRYSHWIFPNTGAPSLVLLADELVPPEYSFRLGLIAQVPFVASSTDFDSLALGTIENGVVLLGGAPHDSQPYTTLESPGATALSLIAQSPGPAPAGFPDSVFTASFSSPGIDKNGRIYYVATLSDSVSDDVEQVLYRAAVGEVPTSVISSTTEINTSDGIRTIREMGAEVSLFSQIESVTSRMVNSDTGTLLLPVVLDNFRDAVLYVNTNQ